jgi:DNA-directed RNA polymerase sigma subunit (sigma70/sigma32)
VSLPVRKQQIASRIEKLVSHNPSISTEELIAALPDISEKDIKELRATNFLTFYIEDMLPSPSSPNDLGAEELEEFKIDPIGAEVNKRLDSEKLAHILSKLKEEEFKVIDLLFGFSQEKCLKIPAIAKTLGRSKEEIKAIRDQALSTISVSLNGVNPLSD